MLKTSIASHTVERRARFGKVILTNVSERHFERFSRKARPVRTHPSAITIQPGSTRFALGKRNVYQQQPAIFREPPELAAMRCFRICATLCVAKTVATAIY